MRVGALLLVGKVLVEKGAYPLEKVRVIVAAYFLYSIASVAANSLNNGSVLWVCHGGLGVLWINLSESLQV